MSFPSDENLITPGAASHGENGPDSITPSTQEDKQPENQQDAQALPEPAAGASEEAVASTPEKQDEQEEEIAVEITGSALPETSQNDATLDLPLTPEAAVDDPDSRDVEEVSDTAKPAAELPSDIEGEQTSNESVIEGGYETQSVEPVLPADIDGEQVSASDIQSIESASQEEPALQPDSAASEPTAEPSEAPLAPMAATQAEELPETSLNEEVDEQAESEAAKEEDFHSLSRRDLIGRLQQIGQQDKISDPLLRKIRSAYDDQLDTERNTALASFKQEGGVEEDFEFRKDADAIEFEQLYRMLREKRKAQLEEVDKTKRINLKQKQQLIEDLKGLNEQEESGGSLEEIKRIMERWRSIGPVPHTDAQELFKNFDFQVDKFYSRRTEFFELKELDRKKNLERKTSLLERAKKTLEEPVFVNGLREYNRILEEFRHTGPAPKDENDRLYTEIKAIGTQLHESKKQYDEAQRAEAEKVAAVRQGLVVQMDVVSNFSSETIAEWQTQSDLVQKLIGEWKGAGARFRDQDPEVSKRFWGGLKKFYATKDAFFKKLDKERAENLAQKREILAKVQELTSIENKSRAQNELNQLVAQWKEIGPVAYKERDKLNKAFSTALDSFYDAKRNAVSGEQLEQRENLAKKQALVDRLNALIEEKKGDAEELREIQREFQGIGFVPFKKKDEINAAFKDAMVKAIEQTSEIPQGQKAMAKLEVIRGGGGGGRGGRSFGPAPRPEQMGQRGQLNKRIAGLETDVRNYRNNMDFIAATKNGEKLKAEFNERIAKAEEEISLLREQLKTLDTESKA